MVTMALCTQVTGGLSVVATGAVAATDGSALKIVLGTPTGTANAFLLQTGSPLMTPVMVRVSVDDGAHLEIILVFGGQLLLWSVDPRRHP